MKIVLGLFFAIVLLMINAACKTNQTKNHERVGRWKVKMRYEDQIQTIHAKYNRKGFGKGIWQYRLDGKLYKKETYSKEGICYVTTYYTDGTTESIGQTKLDVKDSRIHWYYTGDWFYFDEEGKLKTIRNYKNGELIRETLIKKQQ